MPVTTYDNQNLLLYLYVSQLTRKKTPSLTSSQRKRCLTDKLSSRNFSSGFKPKVSQHSQDKECDVLFTSCGQSNAREIGNFKQGHRKQRKIQAIVGATKPVGYERRIMNRQQPHATGESEKKKLETEEDKLGNHHNDPDHMVNEKIWYKYLWRELIKLAKKIANSETDADSSSYKSMSIKTRATKRPLDSTRTKLDKKFVPDENLIFPSSDGVKIESWEKVSYSKIIPATDVSSHLSSPNQINVLPEEVRRNFINRSKSIHSEYYGDYDMRKQTELNRMIYLNRNNEERCFTQGTEKENKDEEKDEVAENHQEYGEHLVSSQNLDILTTQDQIQDEVGLKTLQYEAVEKLLEYYRDYDMQKQTELNRMIYLNRNNEERCITQGNEKENENVAENHQEYGEHLVTSQNLDMLTTQDQIQDENRNNEERCITQGNKKENENVAENHHENGEHLVTSQNLDMLTTQDQIQDEVGLKTLQYEEVEKLLEYYRDYDMQKQTELNRMIYLNRNNEERCITQGTEKENKGQEKEEVAENHQENGEHLVSSQNLDMLTTQDQIQDEGREAPRLRREQTLSVLSDDWRLKSTEASEGSANRPIHPDDHRTTFDSREDNWIGMPGSMVNENCCKVQAKQIPSSEANTDASSNESLSTVESTRIGLYRNVIRNETYIMMSSIDMVRSEAEQLLGLERSQIFFDLLAAELCRFESAGSIISEFVPNMAESTVRQNVISFFEHAFDTMNRLMTLLLRCPDSKILQ